MTVQLVALEDVPEGHYVWCRAKQYCNATWFIATRLGSMIVLGAWSKIDTVNYEFAIAEQQPGEDAAAIRSLIERRNRAIEDFTRLRDGIERLEQEMRDKADRLTSEAPAFYRQRIETFEGWASRLAALRAGKETGR